MSGYVCVFFAILEYIRRVCVCMLVALAGAFLAKFEFTALAWYVNVCVCVCTAPFPFVLVYRCRYMCVCAHRAAGFYISRRVCVVFLCSGTPQSGRVARLHCVEP